MFQQIMALKALLYVTTANTRDYTEWMSRLLFGIMGSTMAQAEI